MGNSNLSRAKSAKNDEFYTQYADIQKEINAYLEYDKDVFRDKTILLPCDDPEWSNFTKFFAQNFENFGLKKLISTSYAIDSKYELYGQIELNEDADFVKSSPNYDCSKNSKKGKFFTLTSVLLVITLTKPKYGKYLKWMLTMLQPGLKAVQQI